MGHSSFSDSRAERILTAVKQKTNVLPAGESVECGITNLLFNSNRQLSLAKMRFTL